MVVRLYHQGSPNWAPAFAGVVAKGGVVASCRGGRIAPEWWYYAVSVVSFAFA
jgi:hypothetical protein